MNKSKLQKTLTETLSQIDGAMASLDSYPELEDAVLSRVQGEANKFLGKIFPTQLDFAKEVLEHLVGTNVLIDIVSSFLTTALPEVEIGLKAALLANMNNLGSGCTIDPIIYEKAVKEGVLFDLKQIDLVDKLSVSPLDKKIGKYYYFGIEGCESTYDLLQSAISPNNQTESQINKNGLKESTSYINQTITNSVGHYMGERKRDFDCLLWYMKNKAAYREVWGKRTNASEDIFNCGGSVEEWLKKSGSKKSTYYQVDNNQVILWGYNNDQWANIGSGEAIKMSEDNEYIFLEGTSWFTYSYGNPQIKKISRNKVYTITNELYYYDDGWKNKTVSPTPQYTNVSELPIDIKENDAVYIDNVLYVVKSFKIKDNKLQNVKLDETIDVTNDYAQKTCLFIDYDENNNKEKIKNNDIKDIVSAFGNNYSNVKKTWNKSANDNNTLIGNTNVNNLYYITEDKSNEHIFNVETDTILISPRIFTKTKDNDQAEPCVNVSVKDYSKYTKDFGVITLEFTPTSGNVKQSDGDPLQQQTPYDNALHVFFGNVKELPDSERDLIETNVKYSSEINKIGVEVLNKIYFIAQTHYTMWQEKEKEWQKRGKEYTSVGQKTYSEMVYVNEQKCYSQAYTILQCIGYGNGTTFKQRLTAQSEAFDNIDELKTYLNKINDTIDKYYTLKSGTKQYIPKGETFSWDVFTEFIKEINEYLKAGTDNVYCINAFVKRASQIMEANENLYYLSAKNLKYPEPKQNYYLKRSLFEFNADYINSLQLFDSKVLAAQLITSLFGSLTISTMLGATAVWKTELIRDTVKNIVEKTIAAQDYTVSDCFFTFTNDAYNGMLRATELRQAGLYSNHGEENGNNKINPIDLLEGLNDIDNATDQSEQISIIKGTILNVAQEVSKDVYNENSSLAINTDLSVQVSFIETLVTNLCTQLVLAMLSPKVYLCILINLQMFGLTTNYDLKSFIQNFYGLISSLINSVVNQFMQYLSNKIIELVEDLSAKLAEKITFEQAEMYMRLIKQIWQHFKGLRCGGDGYGWTQDMVDSADIVESELRETTNEC